MTQSSLHQTIADLIQAHPVILFMKGTHVQPMCGFSATVVRILDHLNIPFHHVNVLDTPDMRQGIKEYSDWMTIPQLYIHQEFVGGCDIVQEMFQEGSLQEKLKGIPPVSSS